jgi:hypothetical protein
MYQPCAVIGFGKIFIALQRLFQQAQCLLVLPANPIIIGLVIQFDGFFLTAYSARVVPVGHKT